MSNNRKRAERLFANTNGDFDLTDMDSRSGCVAAVSETTARGGIRNLVAFRTWGEALMWIKGYRYANEEKI